MDGFQFDPSKFNIIVGGSLINGFADGTFVNIEYTSDIWTMTPGIANVVRVNQTDKSASITLTLQKGSIGNAILDGFKKLDEASGLGLFNFQAKDLLNPGNIYTAKIAWIRRTPPFSASKDAPTLEWIIDTPELKADSPGGIIL